MTGRHPAKGLCARALSGLFCVLLAHVAWADPTDPRQLYRDALEDLSRGRIEAFEAAKGQLTQYPLYPYLELHDHLRRLHELSAAEVQVFRERWHDTPVAQRLYDEWMDDLARRGAWDLFVQNYSPTPDVERQCLYLRALDRTGDHATAMAGVEALWMVGTPQPKACDPLFAIWIDRGLVNNGVVWGRLKLALQARQWVLARYLAGLLTVEMRRQGELFYRVARDPALVSDTSHFNANDHATREIVAHGLRRLAMIDPDAAVAAWSTYKNQLSFNPDDARIIAQDLTMGFARHGIVDVNADLTPSPDGRQLLVCEALIVAAINNKDWPAAQAFIGRLDDIERTKQRWQYWLGRAQRESAAARDDDVATPPVNPWSGLAKDRQYYGFLAAQSLGQPLALNDQPSRPDESQLAPVRNRAAMLRMAELYAIADRADARREWAALLPTLDAAERVAAAYVIADMGWVDLSIMAANAADLRDDLALRFPTPFASLFIKESRASAVPIGFLYGIARQESAFAASARSSAGALGLMQLMPATAAATAKGMGDSPPVTEALFDPAVNVHIASRHLAELLARYDGNRVLVAAAYNAGAFRVDRWLRERPARPADVWVETIPFAETRDYVKNVMAFAYIYGQRLGHPTRFLDADEQ